jgi:hypothetical protein
MAKPRSSLAELEKLVCYAEVGGTNIGEYLASCGEELAPRLGAEAEDLRALVHLPDEALAQQLRPHFERRAEHRAAIHADAVQRLALAAAQQLAVTAVWRDGAAVLDVRVLLGELLVDTTQKYIRLDATSFSSRFQVSLPRSLLVNVAKEVGARPDPGAWVDEAGLHLRWKEGLGGLNFIPQCVPACDRANVLCVNIPPPFVERPRPRLWAARAWFSEVLADVALA